MILQTIPIPDNAFWYVVAVAIFTLLFYVSRWWIAHVEERFKVFTTEMTRMRETQALQNQVLEQHSKYIERSESDITKMTQTMIETLQFLTSEREDDEKNPTVMRHRQRGKL